MPCLFNEKKFKASFKTASWDIARQHGERPDLTVLKQKSFLEFAKKDFYEYPSESTVRKSRSFYPFTRELARNVRKSK